MRHMTTLWLGRFVRFWLVVCCLASGTMTSVEARMIRKPPSVTVNAPFAVTRRVFIDTLTNNGLLILGESLSQPPSPRRLFAFYLPDGTLCGADVKAENNKTRVSMSCGEDETPLPDEFSHVLTDIQKAAEAFTGTVPFLLGADQPHVEEDGSLWTSITEGEEPFHRPPGQRPKVPRREASDANVSKLAETDTLEHQLTQIAQDIAANRLNEAEASLQHILQEHPDSYEAYFLLGNLYSRKRNHREAVLVLEHAAALGSENPFFSYYLGGQYCALGELERSEAAFLKATEAAQRGDVTVEDPEELALAVERVRLLRRLVDGQRLVAGRLGEQPFDATWEGRTTGVIKLDFPGHSEQEVAELKQQLETPPSEDNYYLSITQYGQLLRAADLQREYAGCAFDRWFVLGDTVSEESEEMGCRITHTVILSGEIDDDGTMRGSDQLQSKTDHPEKCPKVPGFIETAFVAHRNDQQSRTISQPVNATGQ